MSALGSLVIWDDNPFDDNPARPPLYTLPVTGIRLAGGSLEIIASLDFGLVEVALPPRRRRVTVRDPQGLKVLESEADGIGWELAHGVTLTLPVRLTEGNRLTLGD